MLLRILTTFVMLPLSFSVLAHTSAAQQLTQLLQPIDSFSTRFEQNIVSPTGKKVSSSSGILHINRPGQFYWEVDKPNALRIISDGRYVWTYDIDLEQIIKQKVKAAIVGSPAALLAGEWVNLEKEFVVKFLNKEHTAYLLSPKDKDSLFQEIKLSFKQNQLASLDMQDKLGYYTKIQFTQPKVNTILDPQLFIFHPPKGVDLIVNE